jgi:hypothetical protein
MALALAQRQAAPAEALALVAAACPVLGKALGPGNPRTTKCLAVQAWVQAVAAAPADRAAALAAFVAARARASNGLPAPHLLAAELLAAEAELRAADPAQTEQAQALKTRADQQYHQVLGRPVPQPLLSLH